MTGASVRRDPATDEEFLAQLYKGGELLAAGKVNEAKDHLERAYQLHPKNEKAQNLLGLTYFKLGQFERASTIYEQLVNENPADPTLRVNLGLVYLKTNNLTRSVREFETATDLEPGHKKAHNYLGLALAQAGDYARAREHFVISGSDAMAEKMARAMVSAEAPVTVKMSPPPEAPPEPVPPPAVTAPAPPSAPRPEEVQIEMMSDEEDVPVELDAPAPMQAPSAVTLVSQAQSMGGADGPPLPQPGFEEMPHLKTLHSDWGAQFGMDEQPPAAQPPTVVVSDELSFADDEGPSAATSEAAVATGMQVPASVMTEAVSDEMPLVEGDVVEATVEEVPMDSAPVVMVEQNVLVPVEDQGALSDQPLPADHEPMVAVQEEAPSAQAEQSWQAPVTPESEQSWAGVAPTSSEPEQQQWAEEAPPANQWSDPAASEDPASQQYAEAASEDPASQQYAGAASEDPASQQYAGGASGEAQQWADAPAEDAPLPDPVWDGPQAAVEEPASEALPSWVTGAGPSAPEEAPSDERPTPPEVQPGFQALLVPRLTDLGPTLDYAHSPHTGPFHIGPEGLALAINGEMLSRLSGLVAVVGGVDAQPEMRRNRGRPIDEAFGEGVNQLQRVKGHGTMYLELGKANFQAIDLDDEGCYLREERVFAFEESVAFENGRLAAEGITVDMVHLKGHGAVLLKLDGALKAIGVPPGTPLKVPLARLVGWYGHVAPRLRVFVGQATVELTGEGYALLASPS